MGGTEILALRPSGKPPRLFGIEPSSASRSVSAIADHLRFVTAQLCLVCGRTTSDSHLKFAEQRAMGRKVSELFTVPISVACCGPTAK
ncbi:DUF968 domain-containing protein [Bradyrhizobium diazoefficiens]|uniref:DUF968 domain-containing protein n=1 Tax=Bradyrhizobium TaxID=374 RepID=UPI003F736A9E